MRMYATNLTKEFPKNSFCEHCGKGESTWGVVPMRLIEELQKNVVISKKEAAIYLLEESETGTIATGEILCTRCLEERSGQPIPWKEKEPCA